MKIVAIQENINQSSTPYRLMKNLRQRGIDISLVVMRKNIEDENVYLAKPSFVEKIKRKISLFVKKKELKKKGLYVDKGIPYSVMTGSGIDLAKRKNIKEADIIQIHWIGGYYLSTNNLRNIINMGKPVIFVNHDTAHFTGGCHIRLGCEKYKTGCGACEELHSAQKEDITYRLVEDKKKSISSERVCVVSPSRWMDESASQSLVFEGCSHIRIPNAVDTDVFSPKNRISIKKQYDIAANKIILLFGAVNAVNAPHKGYKYLKEAILLFFKSHDIDKYELVIFGSDSGEEIVKGLSVKYMGRLGEKQMSDIYNVADVYIFPSIDDNLPGTVLEASASSLPVVAFTTGGVPDIIEHKKTGYLAQYKDSVDLSEGIDWVLKNNIDNALGNRAREKMLKEFSKEAVGNMYIGLYNSLINQ